MKKNSACVDFSLKKMEAEDIRCPICMNEYDKDVRVPKYYDCHHTFCFPCLKARSKAPRCFLCSKGTTTFIDNLATNHYILQLQESKRIRGELSSENRQLKLEIEFRSKWCSKCNKLADASCGKLCHLLVEMDEKRKVFPCTEALQDLMIQTETERAGIVAERNALGESLKKAEDHLNSVRQLLRDYIKSNEKRSQNVTALEAQVIPALNTHSICQYEGKYRSFIKESVEERGALKNMTQQAEFIDTWKDCVHNYKKQLLIAQDQKQEFGQGSQRLFKLLLDLIAPAGSRDPYSLLVPSPMDSCLMESSEQ